MLAWWVAQWNSSYWWDKYANNPERYQDEKGSRKLCTVQEHLTKKDSGEWFNSLLKLLINSQTTPWNVGRTEYLFRISYSVCSWVWEIRMRKHSYKIVEACGAQWFLSDVSTSFPTNPAPRGLHKGFNEWVGTRSPPSCPDHASLFLWLLPSPIL